MKRFFIPLIFVGLLSCNQGTDPTDEPDQATLLTNIGENLILKSYETLNADVDKLVIATGNFAEDQSESNLLDMRDKWIDAYTSWQKAAIYNFGPAENRALLSLNFYPADTDLITDYITSGEYNLNTAGATFAKGFPALDYLLFGTGVENSDVLAFFSDQPAAIGFLEDVTANIKALTEAVYNDWITEYLDTFKNNTGTSRGGSLSLLVNGWSQYLEIHVRNGKVGIPNGNSVVTSQRFGPFPEKSEAFYSRAYTTVLLQTSLNAITDFYKGEGDSGDGEGLYDYLNKINAQNGTLAEDYLAHLEKIEAEAAELNNIYVLSIEQEGEQVTDVFNELKSAVALLKVDIVSALSISITYADNDGD